MGHVIMFLRLDICLIVNFKLFLSSNYAYSLKLYDNTRDIHTRLGGGLNSC